MTFAFITLLTSDLYVPGALVLAQTLKKELKTKHDLAILLDTSNVSDRGVELIKEVYDDIIEIDGKTINTSLSEVFTKLGRTELAVTFSKILLWDQTKYDKLIYIDCDTLPLKNLDHIFVEYGDIEADEVVASPDIGWPDIFNSGLLLLKPHKPTFDELKQFSTKQGASFDGADQGLLNEFFHLRSPSLKHKWKRLPFIYNVTPSTNYQYAPALTRFFDKINLVHFIGTSKPWQASSSTNEGGFHQLWWDKFNKYYSNESDRISLLSINSYKGEGHKLHFNKLESWSEQPVSTQLDQLKIGEVKKVFPWEHRLDKQPATRVFGQTYHEPAVSTSKVSAKHTRNIETSESGSPPAQSSSTPHYEFGKTGDKFNPDKSLSEIAKLPLKMLRREKKEEKKE